MNISFVISLSIFVITKNLHYFKQANRVIYKLIIFYLLCILSLLWAGLHIVIVFKALEVLCNLYLMYIIASKIGDIKLLYI